MFLLLKRLLLKCLFTCKAVMYVSITWKHSVRESERRDAAQIIVVDLGQLILASDRPRLCLKTKKCNSLKRCRRGTAKKLIKQLIFHYITTYVYYFITIMNNSQYEFDFFFVLYSNPVMSYDIRIRV